MIATTTSKAMINVGKGVSKIKTFLPTKPTSNINKLAKKIVGKDVSKEKTLPPSNINKLAKTNVGKDVSKEKTLPPSKSLMNTKATKDPKNLITSYMVKATDTRPGTKGAPTKETAKNMSEVQNDIQIRQKDVDDFTEEEKKYFENAFSRKQGPPKIVRTQNNPIILREKEEFKGEVPILKN